MYTSDRSVGEALAQRFRAMGYEIPDERIVAVGAAIGSHVGPNACGMVYVTSDEA
jgi:fatty acid-binding protein DegV